MKFCRRCGSRLTNVDRHVFSCSNGHTIFANCSPSTGIFFITDKNTVLLSKRGIEPHKGMLDAFGGFIDGEETVEEALERELLEETELSPEDYEAPRYLCSSIGHYPYQDDVIPVITILFWTKLKPEAFPKPKDDVADIVEVSLADIDLSEIHDEDIRQGILELQKIMDSKTYEVQ